MLALGFALAAAALAPVCISYLQTPSGTRHYYTPAAGAALVVATTLSAVRRRFHHRAIPWGATLGLALFAAASALSVRDLERTDYYPKSAGSTRSARALDASIAPGPVVLVNSPLHNLMHAQQFLMLFHGIPPSAVEAEALPRAAFTAYYAQRRTQTPSLHFLVWSNGRWQALDDLDAILQFTSAPGDPDITVVAVER
jgi:hypothetical protein